jgi:hypothetical protein
MLLDSIDPRCRRLFIMLPAVELLNSLLPRFERCAFAAAVAAAEAAAAAVR